MLRLLLPVLAVAGRLLVVEAGVLGLDGCQAQLDGLVEQLAERLEPVRRNTPAVELKTGRRPSMVERNAGCDEVPVGMKGKGEGKSGGSCSVVLLRHSVSFPLEKRKI